LIGAVKTLFFTAPYFFIMRLTKYIVWIIINLLNCITIYSSERMIFLSKTSNIKDEKVVINKSTTLKPYGEDGMYKVDKLFFSAVAEEDWLNLLASHGFVLVKRMISGYVFAKDAEAKKYYYSVYVSTVSAEAEASQAVIEKRLGANVHLLYTHGNKIYYKSSLKDAAAYKGLAEDAASKRRHLKGVFAFNAGLLSFFLGLLCYNLMYWVRLDSAGALDVKKDIMIWDFTIDMSAIFGDYPTTPYVSLFLVLTVLSIPFTVYFLDQYLYSRRFEKDLIGKSENV